MNWPSIRYVNVSKPRCGCHGVPFGSPAAYSTSPIWSMWMNGSSTSSGTPANARWTGKPSPSKPVGAVVTEVTGRPLGCGRQTGQQQRVCGYSGHGGLLVDIYFIIQLMRARVHSHRPGLGPQAVHRRDPPRRGTPHATTPRPDGSPRGSGPSACGRRRPRRPPRRCRGRRTSARRRHDPHPARMASPIRPTTSASRAWPLSSARAARWRHRRSAPRRRRRHLAGSGGALARYGDSGAIARPSGPRQAWRPRTAQLNGSHSATRPSDHSDAWTDQPADAPGAGSRRRSAGRCARARTPPPSPDEATAISRTTGHSNACDNGLTGDVDDPLVDERRLDLRRDARLWTSRGRRR